MATTSELLNRMENLIEDLGKTQTKSCTCSTGISTIDDSMDILMDTTLSVTQRIILLFLINEVDETSRPETKQIQISTKLGISMKCVRENCEVLMKENYLKRGTIASTWALA